MKIKLTSVYVDDREKALGFVSSKRSINNQ